MTRDQKEAYAEILRQRIDLIHRNDKQGYKIETLNAIASAVIALLALEEKITKL